MKTEKTKILGDYWNSYVYGAAYPESVLCTPDDLLTARNKEFYNLIRSKDSIYVPEIFYKKLGSADNLLLFDGIKYKKIENGIYNCGGTSFYRLVKEISD